MTNDVTFHHPCFPETITVRKSDGIPAHPAILPDLTDEELRDLDDWERGALVWPRGGRVPDDVLERCGLGPEYREMSLKPHYARKFDICVGAPEGDMVYALLFDLDGNGRYADFKLSDLPNDLVSARDLEGARVYHFDALTIR